jgi:hypothetical protein
VVRHVRGSRLQRLHTRQRTNATSMSRSRNRKNADFFVETQNIPCLTVALQRPLLL